MTVKWVDARILKRGSREYRVTIADEPVTREPATGEWTLVEEHIACLDGSTDCAVLESQLTQLCEPPVSYEQAKKLLADVRGNVLGQTPAPVAIPERKYATILRRLGARIGDSLLFMPFVLVGAFLLPTTSAIWGHAVWFGVLDIAIQAYEIVMLGIYGQTLGKMACQVVVRDISERPLSMKQAVLRNIVGLILLPLMFWVNWPLLAHSAPFFAVWPKPTGARLLVKSLASIWSLADILTIFTNEKNRALHDYIAGSVVIRTEADAIIAAAKR
jgi:uncharacterized RDD family membrane protein YckC